MEFYNNVIDIFGEYMENRNLYNVLIIILVDVKIIVIVYDVI